MNTNDLKEFQVNAATQLVMKIQSYGTDPNDMVHNRRTGFPEPYVCNLRAITGAGKTPILAHAAAQLSNSIILWTTNRGAVVEQTAANLSPGGKYAPLLPTNCQVYLLSNMSEQDWEEVMLNRNGLSILVATVASFNGSTDSLRVHREGLGGTASRWMMLAGKPTNTIYRQRDLYVFYDEGHGINENQFSRLAELNPKAFVLASASGFPDDLIQLLPDDNVQSLKDSLKKRTVEVSTATVALEGLLKDTLYFLECNVGTREALELAVQKHTELSLLMRAEEKGTQQPIACYIVNSTSRGIAVWSDLIDLGIPSQAIAVHLSGAAQIARDSGIDDLIDTYSGRSGTAKSPAVLRENGYTHIIWNISLREGWDEPFAYVAYLDERGKSITDIVQKIGRFLRQPNAVKYASPELNSAYFYFRVDDPSFKMMIEETTQEMREMGYDTYHSTSENPHWPDSQISKRKGKYLIPEINVSLGKTKANDQIMLKRMTAIDISARRASGHISEIPVDVKNNFSINENAKKFDLKQSAGKTTIWEFLRQIFRSVDTRIVNDRGTIFSPSLSQNAYMTATIEYGSPAMETLRQWAKDTIADLQNQISFDSFGIKFYEVPDFVLHHPDISGVDQSREFKYRVRSNYRNGIHSKYNDFNTLEEKAADAIDELGLPWCRNPSTSQGYGIPIPKYGRSGKFFRPDFLVFSESMIYAIETKGSHLVEAAVWKKLLNTKQFGVEVVFVLEGHQRLERDSFNEIHPNGYTILRNNGYGPVVDHFDSLSELMSSLIV